VKEEISPVPAADRPVVVLLLTHEYVVPPDVLVKLNEPVVVPLQYVPPVGAFIVGEGLTVMVNISGVPLLQPVSFGVTVTDPVSETVLVLVAVKDEILPVPEAPRPMEVLLFVQE
jgi:hypothetical protein